MVNNCHMTNNQEIQTSNPGTDLSTDLSTALLNELLEDLINPSLSALELCQIHSITLTELADILESDAFDKARSALERISKARTQIIEPEAKALAAARLSDVLKDKPATPAHAETQRKVANAILFPPASHKPVSYKRSSHASSPRPVNKPTNPPQPNSSTKALDQSVRPLFDGHIASLKACRSSAVIGFDDSAGRVVSPAMGVGPSDIPVNANRIEPIDGVGGNSIDIRPINPRRIDRPIKIRFSQQPKVKNFERTSINMRQHAFMLGGVQVDGPLQNTGVSNHRTFGSVVGSAGHARHSDGPDDPNDDDNNHEFNKRKRAAARGRESKKWKMSSRLAHEGSIGWSIDDRYRHPWNCSKTWYNPPVHVLPFVYLGPRTHQIRRATLGKAQAPIPAAIPDLSNIPGINTTMP